ncbi:WAT1-related protein At1g25270-like isoform X2 [Papaver somniferum]|nr:WAT1-related protein At1g25270-like isoform X2 [Papaver somniferum]
MGYSSKFCRRLNGVKPALVMVVVQIVFAGMNVFYKLAMNDGMNMMILVAYRSLFATAFVLPLAFFFERKIIPKLTWTIVFQAFLCGLFGNTLAQNFYVASMHLTSASFTAAMANLIPAMTFIMAILCGFEVLGFGNVAGKAKVLGTLIGISGAMLLTFYKGVEIPMWSTHALHIHHDDHGGQVSTSGKRVLGSLLAVGSCLCYATWLMVQTKMSEKIQCYYSSTALMCGMGSIQAVGFALCMERDWTQWQLGWNIRLLASAYSGILASGLMVTLIAWCVHERGALFVSVFNPLMLVLVAIAGSILLDEKLHLGS